MNYLEEEEGEDEGLVAALALIDDIYESTESQRRLRRRRFSRLQDELLRLRTHATALQHALETLRRDHQCDDSALNMTRVWAQVALRQRLQRDDAVHMNTRLKETVKNQCALVGQIATLLQQTQITRLPTTASVDKVFRVLSLHSQTPPALAQRLDAIQSTALSTPIASEVVGGYRQTETIQWNATRDGVLLDLNVTALYPFKLSCIARELWRVLQLDSLGEVEERLVHNDTAGSVYSLLQQPFGYVEVEGYTAMRRVYLPDGSVLLMCVAVSTGPCTPHNCMAALEMHETVRIRIARRDASDARSPVIVEIVQHMDVQAVALHGQFDRQGIARLERLREFALRCSRRANKRLQQELENRLLAASLARHTGS